MERHMPGVKVAFAGIILDHELKWLGAEDFLRKQLHNIETDIPVKQYRYMQYMKTLPTRHVMQVSGLTSQSLQLFILFRLRIHLSSCLKPQEDALNCMPCMVSASRKDIVHYAQHTCSVVACTMYSVYNLFCSTNAGSAMA